MTDPWEVRFLPLGLFKLYRSKTHLAWVRTLPCVRCGRFPCDAAHVRIGTDGGMGLKPSDQYTVPLCRTCHRHQHQIGERRFWGDLGVSGRDVSLLLYQHSRDDRAALSALRKALTAPR